MRYSGIIESKKHSAVNPNTGLHAYDFEEPSGELIDLIGNINGTPNGVTYDVAGFEGKAYQFDGVDDFVQFPNNLEMASFPFAVSFYIKKLASGDRITAVNGRSNDRYAGFDIDIRSNAIYCGYGNGGDVSTPLNRRTFVNTAAGINDTDWHKISVEFIDKSTIKLYKDSTLYNMTYHSGGSASGWSTNFNYQLRLMSDIASPSTEIYSKGILDKLRTYNRLLNSYEK